MGVYLYNTREEVGLSFRNIPWARILYLAEDHGWQPMGTVDPYWHHDPDSTDYSNEPWNGSYASNDLQTVKAEDANALADALERALDHEPDHEINTGLLLGPEGRRRLRELIAFCRKGNFLIA